MDSKNLEERFNILVSSIQTHDLGQLEDALSDGFPSDYRSIDFVDWTLLEKACAAKSVAALKILLRHGVNINAVDKNGDSALHLACSYGYFECVRFLLDAGADWTLINKKGQTPAETSLDESFRTKVTELIDYCIEKRNAPKKGKTIYEYEI